MNLLLLIATALSGGTSAPPDTEITRAIEARTLGSPIVGRQLGTTPTFRELT